MHLGFSYIGLIWLIMLFVPNIIWTKHKPKDYDKFSANENKVLLVLERIGQVAVTFLAPIFTDFNINIHSFHVVWLLVSFLCMVAYEAYWIQYFKSEHKMSDMYKSFIGVPVAGATLPVAAFFLLGVYGYNFFMIVATVILGIGHIGIHINHSQETEDRSGLSLRDINVWLIVTTVIMAAMVLFSSVRMTSSFKNINKATDEYMELEKAAHKLMEASDYLTERVQRFTINGERRFLDEYFNEAFNDKNRDEALNKLNTGEKTEAAFKSLEEAMAGSVELMDREYYAMKLVIEAKGYTDYPEVLKEVTLSPEDEALSDDEKIRLATEMVLSDEYYDQKDKIREKVKECLNEIDILAQNIETNELMRLFRQLTDVTTFVLIQAGLTFTMVGLTSYYGIHPIIKAVDKIRSDKPIREIGASEFRYLAKAYNKMYLSYKNSLEELSFQASHDELTGAYNRAGYDLLLEGIDLSSTYMMIIDVDDFKGFNDNYGHEVGDKVLIKVVSALKSVFRDDDCICRIGGDEFVVFMVHSGNMQKKHIESKIFRIREKLEDTSDGLPPVSLSIGIVHGKDVSDTEKLFERGDEALYESKKKGKNTYTFYNK